MLNRLLNYEIFDIIVKNIYIYAVGRMLVFSKLSTLSTECSTLIHALIRVKICKKG